MSILWNSHWWNKSWNKSSHSIYTAPFTANEGDFAFCKLLFLVVFRIHIVYFSYQNWYIFHDQINVLVYWIKQQTAGLHSAIHQASCWAGWVFFHLFPTLCYSSGFHAEEALFNIELSLSHGQLLWETGFFSFTPPPPNCPRWAWAAVCSINLARAPPPGLGSDAGGCAAGRPSER